MTSLVCNVVAAGHANGSLYPGGDRFYPGLRFPLGPHLNFISVQKGSWLMSCSHCLSSSQLFISMDVPGFSLEGKSDLLLSLFLRAVSVSANR